MNHKNAFTCRLFEQMFLVLYHLLLKLIFVYFSLLKTHIVSNFSMYPLYSTCVNNEKNHAFISAKMLTWDLKFVSLVISLLQGPESKHGGPWERRSERGGFNSKLKPKIFFLIWNPRDLCNHNVWNGSAYCNWFNFGTQEFWT